MYKTTIKGKLISISYADTSVRLGAPQYRKLKVWLNDFLTALEEFLWTKRHGGLALRRPKKAGLQLSLTLCGNEKIRRLNHRFRGKLKTTDVISLQYLEELEEIEQASGPFDLHLGDIFICREVAKRQANKFKIRFEEEFTHLLVHGALHVLGYDHERSREDELIMEKKEQALLKRVADLRKKRRLTHGRIKEVKTSRI